MQDEDKEEISSGVEKKQMSEADFAAARELYELGKASVAELAKDYGISRQALSKRLKAVNSIRGSKLDELQKVAAAAMKATTERFAEKRAEMIEETRMTGISALKQARMLAQKLIVDQARKSSAMGSGLTLAPVDEDLKAIERYNRIISTNIVTSLSVLNADDHTDEEDLPVLQIEDLTDGDILSHHIGTGAMDEDATIEDLLLGREET